MSDLPPGKMPTIGDEPPRTGNQIPPTSPPRRPPPPPPPQRGGTSTSPWWVLGGVIVGFAMPMCACAFIFFSGIFGFGTLVNQLGSIDTAEDSGSGPGIGVLELDGIIVEGDSLSSTSTARMIQDIDWLEDNRDVKAIVVLANSPGGDANASDVIWHRLSQVNKPVYVAVDGMCASGCYYIAMGATPDKIFATPNSLIGSIGVVSTFFNFQELADDIGVKVQVIATGANKDFGSPFRPMTEDEEAYWREQIAVIFDTFIDRVAQGRANHLSRGEIRELANGRVWTASIALDLGLIDEILYTDEVINLAAQDEGLGSNFRIIESPYEPDFFEEFLGVEALGFDGNVEVELPDANDLNNMLQQSPIQYRYFGPYGGQK